MLQNETHKGKGGTPDQSVHGRMGLGTACKGEASRMKNVSIESSGKKLCFWVEKNSVFTEKCIYIYIYIYIYSILL
jgi:hypothetical protein